MKKTLYKILKKITSKFEESLNLTKIADNNNNNNNVNDYNQSRLSDALRQLDVTNPMYNQPLLSLNSTQISNLPLSSMVVENKKSVLNRSFSYEIKLYHAVGGYVAEIIKYTEEEKNSNLYGYSKQGNLHILDSNKLGEELEKAIAYESMRQ